MYICEEKNEKDEVRVKDKKNSKGETWKAIEAK